MEDQIEEIQRLRGCINDLVSLLGLPAMWSGREPPEVVGILLDVLLSVLRLDFAYGRLNVVAGESPIEAIRVVQPQKVTPGPRDVGRLLEPWLTLSRPASASKVPNPVGEGEVSIACLSLGLEQERGVVVAGSQRDDFPIHIETLLLKVAVNQAVIELQRAEILAERNRAAEIERLKNQLHAENFYLRQELNTEQYWDKIVGQSRALRQVLELVEQVAPTNACVLILGETGTGKELIARGIRRLSDRKDRAFIKLSCAAIPASLLESELFGHEKGAFTGAIAKRIGRFELADGGTIFLDEVGEIPLELQPKLLRVLQEQEFERLGSMQTVHVDARLIAATNRHLKQLVADGEFRSESLLSPECVSDPGPSLAGTFRGYPAVNPALHAEACGSDEEAHHQHRLGNHGCALPLFLAGEREGAGELHRTQCHSVTGLDARCAAWRIGAFHPQRS
jgi:Sigma-54 interaction domain